MMDFTSGGTVLVVEAGSLTIEVDDGLSMGVIVAKEEHGREVFPRGIPREVGTTSDDEDKVNELSGLVVCSSCDDNSSPLDKVCAVAVLLQCPKRLR